MSHIEDLIEELCPNGVEYRPLGEIAEYIRGVTYKKSDEDDQGPTLILRANNIDVASSTLVLDGIKRVSSAVRVRPSQQLSPGDILICAGSGSKEHIGKVAYIDTEVPYTFGGFMGAVRGFGEVLPRFIFYLLTGSLFSTYLERSLSSTTINNLNGPVMNRFRIPVPPRAVQQEIVRILDKFTALEAELEAELEARKKQYEHYRAQLLRSGDGIATAPLGTLAVNLDGQRRPIAKGARIPGQTPYFGASGIVDYVDGHIFDGDFLLVSEDGANLLARSTPIAFSASGKIWVNNHAHVLQFDTYAERRYAELYINSIDLTSYISSAAQPKLNQANLNRIPVPCPSLEEKVFIVDILDKFDALVNDLSVGLPAELGARRKQYEYYRDRLLTFKELAE